MALVKTAEIALGGGAGTVVPDYPLTKVYDKDGIMAWFQCRNSMCLFHVRVYSATPNAHPVVWTIPKPYYSGLALEFNNEILGIAEYYNGFIQLIVNGDGSVTVYVIGTSSASDSSSFFNGGCCHITWFADGADANK